jgi:hypothetical protein
MPFFKRIDLAGIFMQIFNFPNNKTRVRFSGWIMKMLVFRNYWISMVDAGMRQLNETGYMHAQ